MKKRRLYFIILSFMLLNNVIYSQNDLPSGSNETSSFQDFYDNFYNALQETGENGEEEDSEEMQFFKWAHFWENRLSEDNIQAGMTGANTFMNEFIDGGLLVCESGIDDEISWTELGPFDSYSDPSRQNIGRIEAITVHPTMINNIVVGARNGGIWITNDGGENWTNTTDDEGYSMTGISALARHPANPDIIYAATGGENGLWNNGRTYGVGVIMSNDGGISWESTGHNYNLGFVGFVSAIAIDPNSTESETILYIGSSGKLRKYAGGSDAISGTWTYIFEGSNNTANQGRTVINDIEVENDGTVWFTNIWRFDDDGANSSSGLYRIQAGSSNPTAINNYEIPSNVQADFTCNGSGETFTDNPVRRDLSIEINNQNHLVLLVRYYSIDDCSQNGNMDWQWTTNSDIGRFLYRTTDSGLTWETPKQVTSDYVFFGQLAVDPDNSDIIYIENSSRRIRKSTNFGDSYTTTIHNRNHVDIRTLVTYNDGDENTEVLFVGTDGGISKTTNGNEWEDITGLGLACTSNYGMGISEFSFDYIMNGAQDASVNLYNKGDWITTAPGGDNGDGLLDFDNDNLAYLTLQYRLRKYEINANGIPSGTSTNVRPEPLSFMFPLLMNPTNSDEIMVPGRNSGLWISDNQGEDWVLIPSNGRRVTSMGMSESNRDVLYYGITNALGVMKAERINGIWVESGPLGNSVGFSHNVTDIAVDSKDENNIWVCISGFSPNKKVYHSIDGGQHWENESNCLPNITMTAISYQKGSNDGIYVGSDFGVFYKNADMDEWIHYGNGGPRTLVADMEINNCSGELIVATQGRGLWKVPLLEVDGERNLSSNEEIIWDFSQSLVKDLRIAEGTTLRIKDATINIKEGKKITVEKGARLIVDNSILTSLCGGMWRGIIVEGDETLPQGTNAQYYQGYVRLQNEATIENAQLAVSLIDPDSQNSGGGILLATDARFINNMQAIHFGEYQNTFFGQPVGNISRFTQCRFEINDDFLPDYSEFKWHVKLKRVTGIEFIGCKFYDNFNDNTGTAYDKRVGIQSEDSHFTVSAKCVADGIPTDPCENYDRSEFSGFKSAIVAYNMISVNTFSVSRTDFLHNHTGIYASRIDNINIVLNKFVVGMELSAGYYAYRGAILGRCTGYKIEENEFEGSELVTSSIKPDGLIIVGSGEEPNEVYLNEYENLKYGNLADYNNRNNQDIVEGLEYLCNQNNENRFDFGVPATGSIAGEQGSAEVATANSFTANPPNQVTHFRNAGTDFAYFCKVTEDCLEAYTTQTIEVEESINQESCNSKIPGNEKGKLSETEKTDFENDFENNPDETVTSSEKNYAANMLIRHHLVNEENYDLDAAITWLEQKGSLQSKFSVVDAYLQQGKIQEANAYLENISVETENTEIQSEDAVKEIDDFKAIKKIQLKGIQEELSMEQIIIAYESAIKEIANSGNTFGAIQAKNMINSKEWIYEIEYNYPEDLENAQNLILPQNGSAINELAISLKAVPNPAKEQTVFKYQLPEDMEQGKIVIRNLNGQIIKEFVLIAQNGEITWNISDLGRTVYLYSLETNGKTLITKRLVISQ